MTLRFAPRAFLLTAAALLLWSPCARADAEADAKDLFVRGRELRTNGNCALAIPAFRKALEIFPSGLGSARNVAECEEQLGHHASARRTWLDLKRALLTNHDARYQGWDAEAQSAAARLAPLVAKLTIELVDKEGHPSPPAARAELVVQINGEALPAALIGTELERDPGVYRIRAERRGALVGGEESVTLGQAEAKGVRLVVPTPPAGTVAPEGGTPGAPADPNATRRLVGWVTIGVGAAALVGATVSLIVRQSASSDLDSACSGHIGCDPALQSTVDRGHLAATLTNVFAGIGIVATGAGIALVLTSPKPATTGFTIRPLVGTTRGLAAEWSLP